MNTILIPIFAATNDVVTAVVESNPSSGASGGMPWWGWWGAAVVAVAAVAVAKIIKAAPSAEKLDEDELLNDVIAAVAKDEPNHDTLRTELDAAISGTAKLTSPALAAILRIEESYEKISSGKYRRRVSILRSKEGSSTGILSKVESDVSWEFLPDAVREEFVRTRQSKVARLIYEAGKDPS